jgi:Holliday junction resolvasome RuvABC endonuclease subunit
MVTILGLDVSSTTIGWSVLDTVTTPPTLVKCGYIKPPKDTTIFSSLGQVRTDIQILLDSYQPNVVAIEDIVQFMQGQSGAKTIIKLAIYNRFVGMVCSDHRHVEPSLLNVNSIRSKIRVGKDRPKKEDIPSVVEHHLGITFPWQYKFNKRTKTNEVMVESYDIADGIAVALAYHLGARPILKVKKAKKKK